MSPTKLIAAIKEAYQGLSTYADAGEATSVSDEATDKENRRSIQFSTNFKRPNCFHFTWHNERGSFIVAHDGTKAYTIMSNKKELCPDWQTALARVVGISDGAAAVILSLLLPDWHGRSLLNMKEVDLIEDDEDTETLYHLRGCTLAKNDTELWLDKSFRVRKFIRSKVLTMQRQQELMARAAATVKDLNAELLEHRDRQLTTEYRYRTVLCDSDMPDSIFKI